MSVSWEDRDYTAESAALSRALGIETPEEKIRRLEAEVQRLKEKALEWKRRALRAGWAGEDA